VVSRANQKSLEGSGDFKKFGRPAPDNFEAKELRAGLVFSAVTSNGETRQGNGPSHVGWVLGGFGDLLVVSSNPSRGNVRPGRRPRGALRPASLSGRVTIAGLKLSMTKAKKMH
jgi:hypothetical protein